jgi:hypothetical protein
MTNLDELPHEATNLAESIELTKTIKFLIGNVETNKYCNDYDRSRSGGGGGDNDDDEIELMQLTNDFRHHHQYGLSSLPHGTIELYDYINYHNILSFKKNNTINNKYTNFNTISYNDNDINNNDNIDNNNITITDNITNDNNTITNDTNSNVNDKYDYKQLCLLDIPSIMIPIEILKFLKLNLQSIVKFEIFRHYNYFENYLAVITFSSNTNGKEFYKIYHNTLLCSLNNYNNKSNNYYCYLYPIKYINYYDSNKIITNDNHHRGSRYNTADHNNNDNHDSYDNIERRRKYSSPLLPLHMTNNVKTSIYNNNNDDKNKDHRHYRSNYQHHSSNNLLSNHDDNHNNQNNNHSFIAIDEDYSVDDDARNAINIFRGISPTNLYYQKHHDHRDDNNNDNTDQNYDNVADIIIKHSIIQSSNHSNENKFIVNLTDVR